MKTWLLKDDHGLPFMRFRTEIEVDAIHIAQMRPGPGFKLIWRPGPGECQHELALAPESLAAVTDIHLDKMSLEDLKTIAAEKGVRVKGGLKVDYIKALKEVGAHA